MAVMPFSLTERHYRHVAFFICPVFICAYHLLRSQRKKTARATKRFF